MSGKFFVSPLSSQLDRLILLSLSLLFGFYLRFHDLGKQSLFLDEAFSADLALHSWTEMVTLAFQDVHPLLYYVFLKLTLITLPLTEWSLRVFSALCATLAHALAIAIACKVANRKSGMLVGWLLAWSSLHLYYAQETRMYTLLELLWLIAPLFLLYALRRNTGLLWVGWALTTALAIHTHFYGLLLWGVGALGSGVIVLKPAFRPALKWWLLAQVIVLILTLPLVALVMTTASRGVGGAWIPSALDPLKVWLLGLFGFTPVRNQFLFGDLLSIYPWKIIPLSIWIVLAFVITLGALVGWRYTRADRKNYQTALWLIVTFGLFPLIIAFALLSVSQQKFWAPRPFIGAVVWLFVGLAIGWSAFPGRIGFVVLAILFVLNVGSLYAYKSIWYKDLGRLAFVNWAQVSPEESVLILDRIYISPVWHFYKADQTRSLIFGIQPTRDGDFGLRRLISDNTLRGQSEPASCGDIPPNLTVGLYDPYGRSLREQWPSCIDERASWQFNSNTLTWEPISPPVPQD